LTHRQPARTLDSINEEIILLRSLDDLALVTSELDALRVVSDKLITAPGPIAEAGNLAAPDKLVKALDEMSKIYGAIEEEFKRYLALDFEPPVERKDRELLHGIAGGETSERLGEMRGHCKKITSIYVRHLKPWFKSTLTPEEVKRLDVVFLHHVAEFDGRMMVAIEELTKWLKQQAADTLDFVNKGQYEAANRHIIAAHKEVLPARQKIREAFDVLGELQAEFIAVAE
jgi:hypothetical protein